MDHDYDVIVQMTTVARFVHIFIYMEQIIALEGSNMNMQTFNAMRSGAKAMQDARGRLDVDEVDDVMDDIKEEMDIAEQVRVRFFFL